MDNNHWGWNVDRLNLLLTKIIDCAHKEPISRLPSVNFGVHSDPTVKTDDMDEKVVAQLRVPWSSHLLQDVRRHFHLLVFKFPGVLCDGKLILYKTHSSLLVRTLVKPFWNQK